MTKRQDSGRKHGRGWKEEGHAQEFLFNAKFNRRGKINFTGASADCGINDVTATKLQALQVTGLSVSLKAGSVAQFHLGDIPELSNKDSYQMSLTKKLVGRRMATCGTHTIPWAAQLSTLRDPAFWRRVIGKGDYYVQLLEDKRSYAFFAMEDVIAFIVSSTKWRLLETGRIKGDLPKKGAKKPRTVLTFEYRPEKASFAIGANGSRNGYLLAHILMENIPYKILK